jgi:hypothetical protein
MKRLGIKDYGHWEYDEYIKTTRKELADRFQYSFPEGSSGPFGEQLLGVWMSYAEANKALLRHRSDFFSLPAKLNMNKNYDFWCDWHATF